MENPTNKFYRMSIGNEVRLKHAYYVKCNSIKKDENLLPPIINCIKSNCTLGEICNVLKNNYGEHN